MLLKILMKNKKGSIVIVKNQEDENNVDNLDSDSSIPANKDPMDKDYQVMNLMKKILLITIMLIL